MKWLLRRLFCRHTWKQCYWGVTEHTVMCTKCGKLEDRPGFGGPTPPGVQYLPEVDRG